MLYCNCLLTLPKPKDSYAPNSTPHLFLSTSTMLDLPTPPAPTFLSSKVFLSLSLLVKPLRSSVPQAVGSPRFPSSSNASTNPPPAPSKWQKSTPAQWTSPISANTYPSFPNNLICSTLPLPRTSLMETRRYQRSPFAKQPRMPISTTGSCLLKKATTL